MYRLGTIGTGTLSHDLNRWWQTRILRHEDPYLKIGQTNDRTTKSNSQYVWALRDIDFKVEQGDVVGIIGKNGAGKSTLLKLLSNITSPTTGEITYEGRIASLLEVGTGFHPEMTGRENIYMNGAIMGMTRQEITRKLDEIVDFAGCARYIDTPVKRYSSGMTVRLGFAIAAFLEPEILVVDEVLAVGDAEFQKKAIGKMQDVSKGEGRTVLFVSHNMDSVLNLCNTCVLLENGITKQIGDAQSVVSSYLNSGNNEHSYTQNSSRHPVFIQHVCFGGNDSNRQGIFTFNENIKLSITIRKSDNAFFDRQTVMSFCIITNRNVRVCTNEISLDTLAETDSHTFHITYPAELLSPGGYFFRIDLHIPNCCLFDGQDVCHFTITDTGSEFIKYNGGNNGFIILRPQITTE